MLIFNKCVKLRYIEFVWLLFYLKYVYRLGLVIIYLKKDHFIFHEFWYIFLLCAKSVPEV